MRHRSEPAAWLPGLGPSPSGSLGSALLCGMGKPAFCVQSKGPSRPRGSCQLSSAPWAKPCSLLGPGSRPARGCPARQEQAGREEDRERQGRGGLRACAQWGPSSACGPAGLWLPAPLTGEPQGRLSTGDRGRGGGGDGEGSAAPLGVSEAWSRNSQPRNGHSCGVSQRHRAQALCVASAGFSARPLQRRARRPSSATWPWQPCRDKACSRWGHPSHCPLACAGPEGPELCQRWVGGPCTCRTTGRPPAGPGPRAQGARR